MRLETALLLPLLIATASCDDGTPPADADAEDSDVDAGDADGDAGDGSPDSAPDADEDQGAQPLCADPAERIALPTPAWHGAEGLTPPEGDRAAEALRRRRSTWYDQIGQLRGWPSRPTILLPLSGAATSVDASELGAYSAGERLEATFEAALVEDGRTLLIRPTLPFPAVLDRITLAVGPGVAPGATPLPACGADGEPQAGYGEALASLPAGAGAVLALELPLSQASHQLPALWQAYQESQVLVVDSAEARGLADFGDAAPPPEVAALLRDPAAAGILELPEYRGAEGRFEVDEGGLPQAAGVTRPGFVAVLPAAGEAPFPFVLFQHGGSQNKTDVLALAGPLAAAGFALIAIDLPFHGDRSPSGGGGDLDIINFQDPLATRDNLRQASADHLAILSDVAALNEELAAVLGVADALDPDRSFYMGLSLGGITGSLIFSVARSLEAGALFVAAADYAQIVTFGLFGVLMMDVLDLEPLERELILGFLEAFLEPADPLAYAQRLEDQTVAPRPVLLFQALDDPIISEPSSDYWGLVFGADLAVPFDHEVGGMEALTLPAADNFRWPGGASATTRVQLQAPMTGVPVAQRHGGLIVQPYSQELVAHCFRSLLDAGACEVIDTGFAE